MLESQSIAVSGAAMLLFAGVFVAGGRVHPLQPFFRDRRSAISFGAGISIAYVFVRVLPELHEARLDVVAAAQAPLPFQGAIVYFVALLGFMAFYSLDHLRRRVGESGTEGRESAAFRLHLGGFAAYVALLAYLLVQDSPDSIVLTALYAATIAVHLLGIDHSLRVEYSAAYDGSGRFVLAAMSLLGWLAGLLGAVPALVLPALMALISGAIIVNSAIMELPREKDGRFVPFVTGGMMYGILLTLVG